MSEGSPLYSSVSDQFELCLVKCRTSSQSVQHETLYRDARAKHCYGERLPALRLDGEQWTRRFFSVEDISVFVAYLLERENSLIQDSRKWCKRDTECIFSCWILKLLWLFCGNALAFIISWLGFTQPVSQGRLWTQSVSQGRLGSHVYLLPLLCLLIRNKYYQKMSPVNEDCISWVFSRSGKRCTDCLLGSLWKHGLFLGLFIYWAAVSLTVAG